MEKNADIAEKTPYFTMKRKAAASVCSAVAVVLWLILWLVFPMEFYSLFFASIIGSNLLLIILSAVITFPANFICSKISKKDISVPAHLIINAVGMVGCIYLYSIFRYDMLWLLILGIAVHIAACAVLFAKSKCIKINKINTEAFSRAKMIVCSIICTVCSDCIYYLLFTALLNTFRE